MVLVTLTPPPPSKSCHLQWYLFPHHHPQSTLNIPSLTVLVTLTPPIYHKYLVTYNGTCYLHPPIHPEYPITYSGTCYLIPPQSTLNVQSLTVVLVALTSPQSTLNIPSLTVVLVTLTSPPIHPEYPSPNPP